MKKAINQARALAKRMTALEDKAWHGEKLSEAEKLELDRLDMEVAEIAHKNHVNFYQLRVKCEEIA